MIFSGNNRNRPSPGSQSRFPGKDPLLRVLPSGQPTFPSPDSPRPTCHPGRNALCASSPSCLIGSRQAERPFPSRRLAFRIPEGCRPNGKCVPGSSGSHFPTENALPTRQNPIFRPAAPIRRAQTPPPARRPHPACQNRPVRPAFAAPFSPSGSVVDSWNKNERTNP